MARILLVDDEPLLRETLRIALQAAGHDVSVAQNGAVALALLADQSFDVIVTDVLMPETDGLEMIMRIRKESGNVRIIAMSGGGRTRNMDMLDFAKSFGADAVLPKPFLPRQLISSVTDLMGRIL
jgi:DNA-binding response OmpR family regulator